MKLRTVLASGLVCLSCALHAQTDIGGTTFSANTTLADGDTWDSGNVGIDAGVTVNVPGAATLNFIPADNRNLTGSGTLQIDATGLFLHNTNTSGDNLIVSGAATILNNGTFQFATGGDLQLQNSGSNFTNNGTLIKTGGTSAGGSNDPSYIFPGSISSGGTFLNTGAIEVTAGHLNIAGGSSTGGTFTSSGSGTLSFSGKWTEITGVADDSAGGVIRTSNEDPANTTGDKLTASAATTTLNVTGTGLVLGTGNIDLNGNLLQNDGLLRVAGGYAPVIIDGVGGGMFVNSATGTVLLDNGSLTLTGAGLTNNGIVTLDDQSTGGTTNDTVVINGPNGITNAGGGTLNLNNGTLELNTTLVNEGTAVFSAGTTNTTKVTLSGTTPIENAAGGVFNFLVGTLTFASNNLVNNGVMNYNTNANVTLDGSGRLINNGTFNHQTAGSADNFTLAGSAVFENRGTVDVQDRGDFDLLGASAVFENHGLLVKSVAGSDPTYVFRNGSFMAATGSEVRSNAGTLHFGLDGTSDAAATWTADGGDLQIAGEWTGTITGTSANGGFVQVGTSGNGTVNSVLSIGTGGLVFNIGGDGLKWDRETINTQGNTATTNGLFLVDNTNTRTLSGGGEFVIASGATFEHVRGDVAFADNSILRNQGTTNYTQGSTATSSYSGAGQFINDPTGSVNFTGGTLEVTGSAVFRNQGMFDINGGSAFSGDGSIINDTTGTMTWTSGNLTISGATVPVTNLQNDGTFTVSSVLNRVFSGGGTFTNNGTFNHSITNSSADNIGWNGAGQFINNGLFHFTNKGDYQMEGGTTFTNSATGIVRVNSPSTTDQAQFFSFVSTAGAGTFDNQGTVEVLSGYFRITGSVSGAAQFEDVTLVQNGGSGDLTGGTWVADSTATGDAIIDLDSFGGSSGITSIGTNAVVELTGSGATLQQLSSLATVHGALYVNGSQNFTPPGFLNVESTGIVGGDGAFANTVTVNGTVLPGASRGVDLGILSFGADLSFNPSSSVTLGLLAPTGTVNGSLDSSAMAAAILGLGDLNPTASMHDALDVSGSVTLNPSMTILISDLGASFASGQFYDLMDFTSLAGVSEVDLASIFDLPSVGGLGLTWDTSLFRSDGILFLTSGVIPEPSRAILVAIGLLLIGARRRR